MTQAFTRPLHWVTGCATLLAAGGATAQDLGDIRPGDPRLGGRQFEPFVAIYQVWVDEDDSSRTREYWKWHLQEATVDGRPAWRLVWSLMFPQSTVYDQKIFRRDTFAPVMNNILSFQGNDILDFTGPVPRYTHVPLAAGGDSLPTTRALPADGDRFGGGTVLAVASLPLSVGTRFRLVTMMTDPAPNIGETLWSDYEVTGRETIEAAGMPFDTWILTGGAWTLWIASEPPYVIRRRTANLRWELERVIPTAR